MDRSLKMTRTTLRILFLISLAAATRPAHAQPTLTRSALAGGGGTSLAGPFTLSCTIGQVDAGPNMTGGAFSLAGGFWPSGAPAVPRCGSADFNCDGDLGTDADIESFFACLAGTCPPPPCTSTADFNADGDSATDADIEAFFRVLAGGNC
jgi:hypothetical protein